jgi:hypothetical protein
MTHQGILTFGSHVELESIHPLPALLAMLGSNIMPPMLHPYVIEISQIDKRSPALRPIIGLRGEVIL